MFSLNEKVIYPGHGVAKISRIVEKEIAGNKAQFFELNFLSKDMTILVPTNNLSSVGIRRLSSQEKINDILSSLTKPTKKVTNELSASNWNKRNKEYQFKLRTGNLLEICEIYRDLKVISQKKELSFGEKNLLQQTEALLVEEISIVRKVNEKQAMDNLRELFDKDSQKESAAVL